MQYTRRQRPQLRGDAAGAIYEQQIDVVPTRKRLSPLMLGHFHLCHKVYLPKPSSFLLYTRIAENIYLRGVVPFPRAGHINKRGIL